MRERASLGSVRSQAVFTPSVPTILGLILLRRLGYVVDAAAHA